MRFIILAALAISAIAAIHLDEHELIKADKKNNVDIHKSRRGDRHGHYNSCSDSHDSNNLRKSFDKSDKKRFLKRKDKKLDINIEAITKKENKDFDLNKNRFAKKFNNGRYGRFGGYGRRHYNNWNHFGGRNFRVKKFADRINKRDHKNKEFKLLKVGDAQ